MNICVVGGGHIGTTLSCYIKNLFPEYRVSLFTHRPEAFDEIIKCNDIEKNISYSVKLDCISGIPAIAVSNAELVFIALPHFAVRKAFEEISMYVNENAYIGVVPGGGGCEFFFEEYFDDKKTLFGFQRVPFTAKLEKYGVETNLKSWKPYSVIASIPKGRIDNVCCLLENCGLSVKKASNYLEVALAPSNPILHTARTYNLFKDYDVDYKFHESFKYYVGWDDASSITMLDMDGEIHQLLKKIDMLDTTAIRPLMEHYGVNSVQGMTNKISSIPTFQSVYAPLIRVKNNEYVTNIESRMFREDFEWGLIIIKSYCDLFEVETPTMNRVLEWYSRYMGLEWFVDGVLKGKDIKNTGIISQYGIKEINELVKYYDK